MLENEVRRTRIVTCWGFGCFKTTQGVWLTDGSQVWVNANTDDPHTCADSK